jgi:hypothetical protein
VEQEGVSSEASTNRLAQYAVPSRLPDILTRKGKKTGKFQHSRRMIPPFSAFRDPTIWQELHQNLCPGSPPSPPRKTLDTLTASGRKIDR